MPELRVRGDGSEADQRGGGRTQVPQVRTRGPGGGARAHGAGRDLTVTVIGGGLAGSEAAWALARCGIRVTRREMRPVKMTPAHHTDRLAELVCSNSFKSVELTNAHGLLKAEMRRLGSVVLQAADEARVPGGAALAVDRDVFAAGVHRRVAQHHTVAVVRGEATELPAPGIVATGPLTSEALSAAIAARLGLPALAFFDAIAPIVATDSLDTQVLFRASRYGKGSGDDYLNAPLTAAEYGAFVAALRAAEQQRVLRRIPGLAGAECLRYGSIHRNAYINAPAALTPHLSARDDPTLLFAGQLTGVEGYTESAATGLLAGLNLARMLAGEEPLVPPPTTLLGALYRYLREADPGPFQPMHAT